jgi:uncharacterized protein DUF1844
MSETNFPLPPPTFEFLVFSLKMQAEVRLGLIGFGEESEGPDLPAARHAIDLLAMLAEKTRGNLSLEEQRLVENSLTELRFRFVQVTEDVQKAAAKQEPDASGGASDKTEGGAEAAS